jgi:hypothetical protein
MHFNSFGPIAADPTLDGCSRPAVFGAAPMKGGQLLSVRLARRRWGSTAEHIYTRGLNLAFSQRLPPVCALHPSRLCDAAEIHPHSSGVLLPRVDHKMSRTAPGRFDVSRHSSQPPSFEAYAPVSSTEPNEKDPSANPTEDVGPEQARMGPQKLQCRERQIAGVLVDVLCLFLCISIIVFAGFIRKNNGVEMGTYQRQLLSISRIVSLLSELMTTPLRYACPGDHLLPVPLRLDRRPRNQEHSQLAFSDGH